MNIIDERNTRTVYRKLKKREYDERMKLSATRTEAVRLLDEGMVVDAYGNPLFYIKKGVLQAYYDALPDDYVGTINLGHMNFVTFPFILGNRKVLNHILCIIQSTCHNLFRLPHRKKLLHHKFTCLKVLKVIRKAFISYFSSSY